MFLKHKIVFLGDQTVGKTSLILRFSQDTYDGKQKVSAGGGRGGDKQGCWEGVLGFQICVFMFTLFRG